MSEWKPIETAPKDGSPILLYTADGVIEASWGFHEWEQSPCYSTYDESKVALFCQPTHWMPLPEPPEDV